MTSYWPVRSSVTNGSLIACWWTLFGKYSSSVRPLSFQVPVPGTSRTRTTASLRRPVVWISPRSAGGAAIGVSATVSATVLLLRVVLVRESDLVTGRPGYWVSGLLGDLVELVG